MMTADPLDVQPITFLGKTFDAVKDEYVFRMPQLNAATATSVVDYVSAEPALRRGWAIDPLGSGFYKLTAPDAKVSTVLAWAKTQQTLSIEPNAIHRSAATPNDPLYSNADNWAFPTISADSAWDTSTGSASTIVAVLDTGIDTAHVDLAGNVWSNPNEIPGNGIDDDLNGVGDDVVGYNAFTNSGTIIDDNGHGTFSAGIIGAVGNNEKGISGVNWRTKMMGVKVLDSAGLGTTASIIAGVNYVARVKTAGQSVSTVYCGFAQTGLGASVEQAFRQLGSTGVVIVCAAGNDSNNNDVNPRYPANFDIPTLISVAATDRNDALAGFSNFGPTTVDLAAPGVDILSTRASLAPIDPFAPHLGDSLYTVHEGTSFSAAFVAGTAALLKVVKPNASAAQIKNAILDGADRLSNLSGVVATGARLNVAEAVDLIVSTAGVVPVASFKPGQVTQFVEGNGRYTIAEVRVVLDRPVDPGRNAVVYYETRPGGSAFPGVDFVEQRGFVTFSGSQTERVVRLRLMGDRVAEQNEQFAVRLVDSESRGITVGTAQVNLTIVDDDFEIAPAVPEPSNVLEPRISIVPLRDAAGNLVRVQEGDFAQFVVRLDRTSDKVVTVNYRTNEPVIAPVNHARAGLDYLAKSGTLTFLPGEFLKTISVKTLRDMVNEVLPAGTPGFVSPTGLAAGMANDFEFFSVILSEPTNAVLSGTQSTASTLVFENPPQPPTQPAGPGAFTITVTFTNPAGFTASQRDVFARAAARWEQIIVGDLPDVFDPATGQRIDDVLIEASALDIDGEDGILGGAGPREFRPGAKGLPWKGEMVFDTADLVSLEARGELDDVIVHEMAHVLGFGTAWGRQGLVSETATVFTGVNAVREYNALFGQTATGVPLEVEGGPGTAGGHWSDDLFGNELMTGFLNPGVPNPISRVTVGQFEDLGYRVDYSKADAFVPIRDLVRGQQLAIRMPGTIPGVRAALSAMAAGGAANAPVRMPVTRQPVTVQPPATPARPPVQPQPVVAQSGAPVRQPVTAVQPAVGSAVPSTGTVAAGQLSAGMPVLRTPVRGA